MPGTYKSRKPPPPPPSSSEPRCEKTLLNGVRSYNPRSTSLRGCPKFGDMQQNRPAFTDDGRAYDTYILSHLRAFFGDTRYAVLENAIQRESRAMCYAFNDGVRCGASVGHHVMISYTEHQREFRTALAELFVNNCMIVPRLLILADGLRAFPELRPLSDRCLRQAMDFTSVQDKFEDRKAVQFQVYRHLIQDTAAARGTVLAAEAAVTSLRGGPRLNFVWVAFVHAWITSAHEFLVLLELGLDIKASRIPEYDHLNPEAVRVAKAVRAAEAVREGMAHRAAVDEAERRAAAESSFKEEAEKFLRAASVALSQAEEVRRRDDRRSESEGEISRLARGKAYRRARTDAEEFHRAGAKALRSADTEAFHRSRAVRKAEEIRGEASRLDAELDHVLTHVSR